MFDDDEISIYGTDPTNADTDGDGYPDGREVQVGTSPTTPTGRLNFFVRDVSLQISLFVSGLITAFLGLFTGTGSGRRWWQFW